MKKLMLVLLLSSGAFAGTYPEYVTMKDGSVCTIPLFGNAGQYSLQNYLGLDFDTCKSPGLDKIWATVLNPAAPPAGLEQCESGSGYPCYEIHYEAPCDPDALVVSPGNSNCIK
jgi:hypothetical protein